MSWHGHTSAKITPILASKIIIMSTIPQSYTASEAGIELAIDPAFRLPTAPDRSSAEQPHLAYSAVQQSHVSTETSPAAEGHESSERTKKKNIHGPRLKRACDACSKRKIKCDESGPPCNHCKQIDIPCTFARESRRRGPRNRHADAIKEQLAHGAGLGSGPASPTYAAQTLASLAQQPGLSAESICPAALLERLVDDYFTYVYPLVPVPHEPSFRAALAAREDRSNATFLALLASMIGYLVASFPRRPKLHVHGLGMDGLFPNSNVLIERCRKIAIEARGLGYLDRQQTVDDALVAYLQGLIAAFNYNWDACRLYLGQYVSISRVIGLHRQDGPGSTPVTKATGREGNITQPGGDVVLQETSRRLFWIGFSTIISLQHLGVSARELSIPPSTIREPYPDLPMEIDDICITPEGIRPLPHGEVARLTGFNVLMKVYRACSEVSAMELAYGINEAFNWAQQRVTITQALDSARMALSGLPRELLLAPEPAPRAQSQPSDQTHPLPTQGYPALNGNHNPMQAYGWKDERDKIQFEVQKIHITAAEIATRCTLIETYSRLSDVVQHTTGIPQDPVDDMKDDRDTMIKDFLRMIRALDLTYLEPSGLGFTNKLRQVASIVVSMPKHRKSEFQSSVERYLMTLVDYISHVQRVGPGEEEGLDEEALRARQWADMMQSMGNYI
ncbi:MAG: hypothetical protein LQ341_001334 [Variospora aurantia]|nr:MAG: hypothetical protein LQ341_001334 [Variospora aurantia]